MFVESILGIRNSFPDEFSAEEFLAAINSTLAEQQLPPYQDAAIVLPKEHQLGRVESAPELLDSISQVAQIAINRFDAPHLKLVIYNPMRATYVPLAFAAPLMTTFQEDISLSENPIFIGSLSRLQQELIQLAEVLKIPLAEGEQVVHLQDALVPLILDSQPLFETDEQEFEQERITWLWFYEGVRLALEHQVALSLVVE